MHGFVRVRPEDPCGVEAGAVLDDDDRLALLLAELDGGGGRPVGRLVGDDDLEQRHPLDRREVVHAQHRLGPRRRGGDLADRKRRGVGGEHGLRSRDLLNLPEDRLLQLERLEDGLDHQVAVAETLPVGRGGDPEHCLLAIEVAQALALGVPVDDLLYVGEGSPCAGGVDLLDPDGRLRLERRDRSDAAPHESATDHGDLVDLLRFDALGHPRLALQGSGGEEDGTQRQRLRRDDELAEEPGFCGVAGCRALFDADADRLERPFLRRVVALGLLQQLVSGLLEQQVASDRVRLQRQFLQAVEREAALLLLLRRSGCQCFECSLPGDLHQQALRHDFVDEAELLRLVRSGGPAGEDEVECIGDPDQRREPLGAAARRQHAELHFRLAELRLR